VKMLATELHTVAGSNPECYIPVWEYGVLGDLMGNFTKDRLKLGIYLVILVRIYINKRLHAHFRAPIIVMSLIGRNMPAFVAVAVGIALRTFHWNPMLMKAMYYLRPSLIRARDERERKQLVEKLRVEMNNKETTEDQANTNR
jgi:hypothetical protein